MPKCSIRAPSSHDAQKTAVPGMEISAAAYLWGLAWMERSCPHALQRLAQGVWVTPQECLHGLPISI